MRFVQWLLHITNDSILDVCMLGQSSFSLTAAAAVANQVWERAKRLGLVSRSLDVRLVAENKVERIGAVMAELRPAAVIVDSIQTVLLADVPSRPGSVTQVRLAVTVK